MENLKKTIGDIVEKYSIQDNEIEKIRKQIAELTAMVYETDSSDSFHSDSFDSDSLDLQNGELPNQYRYVAKLNMKKTKILNVFIDTKTTSLSNGYHMHALDKNVKKKKLFDNHYYIFYNECDNRLKENFSDMFCPLYRNGIGQYDSEGNFIQEYVSKRHCCKQLRMCDKKLNKVIKNAILYKAFTFKVLPDRTQMIQE